MKDFTDYICEGQMNIFDYIKEPQVTKTVSKDMQYKEDVSAADKLRAKGWKNIYEELPIKSGIYEKVSIEEPDKIKYAHYTGEGYFKGNWTALGNGTHPYIWWREDTRKYKRKPLIYHMGLSAYYYECPYCKAQNREKTDLVGTYCESCMKYFDGVVERKTKDLKECEEQLGPGGGGVYKDEKGKWRWSKLDEQQNKSLYS